MGETSVGCADHVLQSVLEQTHLRAGKRLDSRLPQDDSQSKCPRFLIHYIYPKRNRFVRFIRRYLGVTELIRVQLVQLKEFYQSCVHIFKLLRARVHAHTHTNLCLCAGQDLLRAEEPGAQVPVLPAGAGGRGLRRSASDVTQGIQGLQQYRLHGVR